MLTNEQNYRKHHKTEPPYHEWRLLKGFAYHNGLIEQQRYFLHEI